MQHRALLTNEKFIRQLATAQLMPQVTTLGQVKVADKFEYGNPQAVNTHTQSISISISNNLRPKECTTGEDANESTLIDSTALYIVNA